MKFLTWDYPFAGYCGDRRAIRSGLMDTVDHYYWLVVEKITPYCAQIYELAQGDINKYCVMNTGSRDRIAQRSEKVMARIHRDHR